MIYRNQRKVLIYKPCKRNKPSVFFLKEEKVSSAQPVSETPASNQSGLPSMRTDLIDKFEFKVRITTGPPTPEVNTPTIIWQIFCRKLYENDRNWTEKGHTSLAPPWIQPLVIFKPRFWLVRHICFINLWFPKTKIQIRKSSFDG